MKAVGRRQKTAARRARANCSCALALAMVAASSALAAGEAAPEGERSDGQPDKTVSITLRLYDYANLSQAVVRWSEETATAIFKQAGMEVAWVDCPVSTEQLRKSPACQGAMGTTDFAVRVLRRPMAATLSTTNDPVGLAQPCPDDERGCVANILYSRVVELTSQVLGKGTFQGEGARTAKILGHAIAHEVGHLVLGPNSHSPAGLMRAAWSPDDVKLMSWGYLVFTPSQCEQLRAGIERRAKAQDQLANAQRP